MIKEHEAPVLFNFYDTVIIMYMENKTVVWIGIDYPVVPDKIFQIHEEDLIEQLHNQTNY